MLIDFQLKTQDDFLMGTCRGFRISKTEDDYSVRLWGLEDGSNAVFECMASDIILFRVLDFDVIIDGQMV